MSEDIRQEYANTVLSIAEEQPTYRLGGDGSDGTCDCVGAGIGGLRRMDIEYDGLHGSNWAARHEAVELWEIGSVAQLRVGDNVLKAYEPGDEGWNLPARYGDDPDQRDYYHFGVVTSVNPLRITHMTSPTFKTDTTLGKWKYAFLWRQLGERMKEVSALTVLYEAFIATQWDPLNLRATPGGRKIGEMAKGGVAQVLEEGEWAMVQYGDMIGYCDSRYLEKIETVLPEDALDSAAGEKAVTMLVCADGRTIELVGNWRVAED